MAKKRAKAKGKAGKKTKRKAPAKKRKPHPKGTKNAYARRTKKDLAEHGPSLHTNGFDLTDQQMAFVEYYLGAANLNATKAAIFAGYSEHSANSQGPALLRNPYVKKYLRKRVDDRNRRVNVSQDKIVKELAVLAFATPGEFASWRGNSLMIKSSDEIPPYLQGAIKSLEPVSGKEGWRLKITFYDKTAALRLLAQHLGMLDLQVRDGSKGTIVEFMERLMGQAGKVTEGDK